MARNSASRRRVALQGGEQVTVDLVLVPGGEAVRRAGVVDVLGVLDDARRVPRVGDGNHLVVLAVDQQGGNVEALEVSGEVGLGGALMRSYELLRPACMLTVQNWSSRACETPESCPSH